MPSLILLSNHAHHQLGGNELGLMGTRFGCGLEQCGCCLVLIEGKPEKSCAKAVWGVDGSAFPASVISNAQDGTPFCVTTRRTLPRWIYPLE